MARDIEGPREETRADTDVNLLEYYTWTKTAAIGPCAATVIVFVVTSFVVSYIINRNN